MFQQVLTPCKRIGKITSVRTRARSKKTSDSRSVSHRESLIRELRSDPLLAAQYVLAAADDTDRRVLRSALATVAAANGKRRK